MQPSQYQNSDYDPYTNSVQLNLYNFLFFRTHAPKPHMFMIPMSFLGQGSFSAEKQKEQEAHCRGFHSVKLILSVHQLQQPTLIWKMTGKGVKATTVTHVQLQILIFKIFLVSITIINKKNLTKQNCRYVNLCVHSQNMAL